MANPTISQISDGSSVSSYDNPTFNIPEDVEKGVIATEGKEPTRRDYSLFSMIPRSQEFRGYLLETFPAEERSTHKRVILSLLLGGVFLLYFVAVLMVKTELEDEDYWCDADGFLIVLTAVVGLGLLYFQVLKPQFGRKFSQCVVEPCSRKLEPVFSHRYASLVGCLVVALVIVIVVVVDAWDDPTRFQSLLGIFVILFLGFLFSVAPGKIRWRNVAWGVALQFIFALIILRWPVGRAVFECLAGKVATFLAFTDEGSGFVFGSLVTEMKIFAFSVLSVTLFFSFFVQILYYWGVMQWIVTKIGWLLQVTVGTTACESVIAGANIFLGMSEAPLLIKPYLSRLTKSEIHAVMTSGFATIAGSVLAAYIFFGVDPVHLLSASVMSAPAALAFAKLFYPETEVSRTTTADIKIEKGKEANWLHAAMVGVTNAIPLVANIAANLIAFYAFVALCDHVFDWTCMLAGAEQGVCTLESIFGRIFMPLSWVMGVEWAECFAVGRLVAMKTIVNEFVAYEKLSEMIANGEISKRAEIIATYALCGFSNIGSIGITLGAFGAMAPDRRGDLAKIVVRAMVAGSAACFLTASVVGSLLTEESFGGAEPNTTTTTDWPLTTTDL